MRMFMVCLTPFSVWSRAAATSLGRWLSRALLCGLVWLQAMGWPVGAWAKVLAAPHAVASSPAQPVAGAPARVLLLDRVNTLEQACILPAGRGDVSPPGASRPWLHVPLPHQWRHTHPGHEGDIWYRFRLVLPVKPDQTWAVYLPKVVMNGQVWINGVALGYSGSMSEPVTRNWYVPLMFPVPSNLWHAGENTVFVRVAAGYQSTDGLAPIQVGPVEQVAQAYQWRRWMQVDGLHIIHVVLIAVGLLMSLVWLRDRSQAAFGYMGMSAVFWGASTLMAITTSIPTSPQTWEVLSNSLTVWHELALTAFFFRFAEVRRAGLYRGIGLAACLVPAYFGLWHHLLALAVLGSLVYVLALVGMACTIWHVLQRGRPDGWWMVLGCAILVPCGWHDVLVGTGYLPYGSVFWLALFGPATMAFSFVILAGDYARSRKALHELNRSLAHRVAERESELRESFERLAELERTQAVSAERSRILRDMHDGVGAHLTSALRQLQAPRGQGVDLGLVTQTLRDSLDQLKLSVDALSLLPGDVQGLLASLRFRITPRLKAAGLDLGWDVGDLPPWPNGQAPALRQLQYILFEGLSNVLQHSGATRLVLSARAFADRIQVSLCDNGRGWGDNAEQAEAGQGLQTMRARASVIGAVIEFHSTPDGGAELRVLLPLQEAAWSDLSSAA